MFLANKIIYLQSLSTAVHLIQNASKQMSQKNSGYRLHASLVFLPLPTRAQISFATYSGIRQLRSVIEFWASAAHVKEARDCIWPICPSYRR